MKICFISMEYPPETNWGGIGTYTFNMAHALVDHGNDVDVIALATGSERDYFDGNVHVHRVKNRVSLPLWKNLMHSFVIYDKLRKLDDFDIIEAPEWGAEGLASAFLHKTHLVTRLHTPLFLVNKLSGNSTTVSSQLINFFERTQTVHSSAISSPTKVLQREIARSWNTDISRIAVIPNGINLKDIEASGDAPNSIDADYIAYVGRLEARKGVHVLAKALPGIFEKFPDLKMVFVGKDMPYGNGTMAEMISCINSKYNQNIIFTGFVTEETKYSLIKNSKFVILPSLWEAFGYTCLESMALGKTVIATASCGFEEIIDDTKSGFLVKAGDHKALQNQILLCLEAEDKLSLVENNAKRRAQDFDIVKVSEHYVKYCENILRAN